MRNLLFYGVAGYYAETLSCDVMVAGHLKSDGIVYSDAREPFFAIIAELYRASLAESYISDVRGITIELPLLDLPDAEAISLGRSLGVPFALTWSCLEDGVEACGACVSCRDRERAFGTS